MEYSEDTARTAVEAVLAGDTEAFAEIVETLQAGMINLAWSYFHDREDALEAVQDFFIHLYKKLSKYSGKSAFRTWSYAVAVNFFNKKSRKKRVRESELPDESCLSGNSGTDGLSALTEDETRQEVANALNSLPQKFGLPIRLFYFEDFSYTELAEVTGLPLGTVRTHLFQGKKMLRQRLKHLSLEWGDTNG